MRRDGRMKSLKEVFIQTVRDMHFIIDPIKARLCFLQRRGWTERNYINLCRAKGVSGSSSSQSESKWLFVNGYFYLLTCSAALQAGRIRPARTAIPPLSFCLTGGRKNAGSELPAASLLAQDHVLGLSTARASSLRTPLACLRSTGANSFEVPRYLPLSGGENVVISCEEGLSSTEVSWLLYQQKNVSSTTFKTLAVVAKQLFFFPARAAWARLLSN